MPKVKTNRTRYPQGWELIEPTLRDLDMKLREAENESHEGKRKCEALWPIFKICHQKTRYIYDIYYRRKAISKDLFEFCLDQGYADKHLIAKWKKAGSYAYEFLQSGLVAAFKSVLELHGAYNVQNIDTSKGIEDDEDMGDNGLKVPENNCLLELF